MFKTILRQMRKSFLELYNRLGGFKDWRLKNKEPKLLIPDLVTLADKLIIESQSFSESFRITTDKLVFFIGAYIKPIQMQVLNENNA